MKYQSAHTGCDINIFLIGTLRTNRVVPYLLRQGLLIYQNKKEFLWMNRLMIKLRRIKRM